ncbi:hypothetical protein BDZ89DRAFT_507110 [Hymenopellis radicata]|nr:hypothetical protein BDZ89DRAFT_507110 [Hymenopellis radicata]
MYPLADDLTSRENLRTQTPGRRGHLSLGLPHWIRRAPTVSCSPPSSSTTYPYLHDVSSRISQTDKPGRRGHPALLVLNSVSTSPSSSCVRILSPGELGLCACNYVRIFQTQKPGRRGRPRCSS